MTMHSRATYDVNHVDLFGCSAAIDSLVNALHVAQDMLGNERHSDPEVRAAWIEGVLAAAIALAGNIAADIEACDARLKAHPGNPAAEAVR